MTGRQTKKKGGRGRSSGNGETRALPSTIPAIDDLPRVPPVDEEITEPLSLDDLDDVLARHTYHLERFTRDRPRLQQLESEVKAERERRKWRLIMKLKDQRTDENEAFLDRFPKPTEALYNAEVEISPEYQEAQAVLLEIRNRLAEIDRVQTILEHRRTTVRGLIDLYSAEYWGIPDRPRNRTERGNFSRRRG